jgi:hypothetical protein
MSFVGKEALPCLCRREGYIAVALRHRFDRVSEGFYDRFLAGVEAANRLTIS